MENGISWERLFKLWAMVSGLIISGKRSLGLVINALQAIVDNAEPRWREEDGIIYFSVESDGKTGEEWITRLEKKGFRLSDYAKSVLCSPDFKPTKGVTTEIAVLKGLLFEDCDLTISNIRDLAWQRKLLTPNAEVACLIREMFTDEEIEAMGLWWIVAIHEPIKDSVGDPLLLGANRGGDGRWLGTYYYEPDGRWSRGGGFAFVVKSNCS